MAQPYHRDAGVTGDVAGEPGHGVGVVQQQRVGADLLQIVGEVLHHGNGAQGTHDAAYAQSVGDGLAQTVLFGDLEIGNGAGFIAAYLDGIDHEGRATERLLTVFHAQIGLDDCAAFIDVLMQGGQNAVAFIQTDRVDIVKRDATTAPGLGGHGIAQNIPGEDGAASTHKSDLQHFGSPLC